MLGPGDLDAALNALVLAELTVDDDIGWNPIARCEYLRGVRTARRSVVKEQRRARKARKNAFMFKTFGRRPWNVYKKRLTHFRINVNSDPLQLAMRNRFYAPDDYEAPIHLKFESLGMHKKRMDYLRERSGFNVLNNWIARRWPK